MYCSVVKLCAIFLVVYCNCSIHQVSAATSNLFGSFLAQADSEPDLEVCFHPEGHIMTGCGIFSWTTFPGFWVGGWSRSGFGVSVNFWPSILLRFPRPFLFMWCDSLVKIPSSNSNLFKLNCFVGPSNYLVNYFEIGVPLFLFTFCFVRFFCPSLSLPTL